MGGILATLYDIFWPRDICTLECALPCGSSLNTLDMDPSSEAVGGQGGDTPIDEQFAEMQIQVVKMKTPKKKIKKARNEKNTIILTKELEAMKAEIAEMKALRTCKVCQEAMSNRVFLPCGHMSCCNTCADKLRNCPICRARCIALVRVQLIK